MERLFYRPKEAAAVLSMSRTAVFRLIKTAELRSVKHEGYRLIPASALLELPGGWRRPHRARKWPDGHSAAKPAFVYLPRQGWLLAWLGDGRRQGRWLP
jgi:Helix-turn-helix domain